MIDITSDVDLSGPKIKSQGGYGNPEAITLTAAWHENSIGVFLCHFLYFIRDFDTFSKAFSFSIKAYNGNPKQLRKCCSRFSFFANHWTTRKCFHFDFNCIFSIVCFWFFFYIHFFLINVPIKQIKYNPIHKLRTFIIPRP